MGRPPLVAGTYGKIRFERSTAGTAWRARTQVRDWDGRTRPVERTGKTKAGAEFRLKLALRDRIRADAVSEITADTKVGSLAEAWFKRLTGEKKAPTTLEQYRRILDRHVVPNLGNLAVRELTIGRCDRYQQAISEKHGAATAKMTRSVLSGICGLACRHDALGSNPIRDVGVIRSDRTPRHRPDRPPSAPTSRVPDLRRPRHQPRPARLRRHDARDLAAHW